MVIYGKIKLTSRKARIGHPDTQTFTYRGDKYEFNFKQL